MERVGLQPARYIQAAAYRTRYRDMKCHDTSISLLGYDMITNAYPQSRMFMHFLPDYNANAFNIFRIQVNIFSTKNN